METTKRIPKSKKPVKTTGGILKSMNLVETNQRIPKISTKIPVRALDKMKFQVKMTSPNPLKCLNLETACEKQKKRKTRQLKIRSRTTSQRLMESVIKILIRTLAQMVKRLHLNGPTLLETVTSLNLKRESYEKSVEK